MSERVPRFLVVATALVLLASTATALTADRPAIPVRGAPPAQSPAAVAEDVRVDEAGGEDAGAEHQPAAPHAGVLDEPLPAAALEAALEAWLASDDGVATAAVAVASPGEDPIVWTATAADGSAPSEALDVDASYGVLSVTKTFTEALVLREAASGRIDLDAPVPTIPGVPPVAGGVITPRMLLDHTSGIANYTDAVGYTGEEVMTPQLAVSLSLASPPVAAPGERAHYSNSNFHWLGLLLEHVTGRSYGELVGEIAAEAGLEDTFLDPSARPGWVGYASGGIRSTLPEVAEWGAALLTPDRLLPAEVLNEYVTVTPKGVALGLWPVCPCPPNADGSLAYEAVGQFVAHGGLLYYPEDGIVLAARMEPHPDGAQSRMVSLGSHVRAALDAGGRLRRRR